MKSFIFILTIYSIGISCSSRKNIDSETLYCFQQKIKSSNINNSISFFQSLENFENVLLNEKLLTQVSKEGYRDMLIYFNYNNVKFKEILVSMQEGDMNIVNASNTSFQFKNCILKTLKNKKKSRYLKNYLNTYEKIQISEYEDIDALNDLIILTDFENKKMRLITSSIFYRYMWSKFTP